MTDKLAQMRVVPRDQQSVSLPPGRICSNRGGKYVKVPIDPLPVEDVAPFVLRLGQPCTGSPPWAHSSTSELPASGPRSVRPRIKRPRTGSSTVARKRSESSTRHARPSQRAISMRIGSPREMIDEIASGKAVDRDCRPQDERQPRGCVLAGAETDCD